MEIYIEKTNETVGHTPCTAGELLKDLGINPDTVLVAKNDEVVLLDEDLSETDKIKILSVVSGG